MAEVAGGVTVTAAGLAVAASDSAAVLALTVAAHTNSVLDSSAWGA